MINRTLTAIILGMKEYFRRPLFIGLLIVLPPAFITLAFLTTPDVPFIIDLPDGNAQEVEGGMPTLHGVVMVPMTAAFLAGMVGLFVMHSSREADRRLVQAGFPGVLLLGVRLALITVMSFAITSIAISVMLIDYQPAQIELFILVNFITALEYGFLGAIVGTFLSPISGMYLMFFAPMIDLGVVQNPMFPREVVAWWMKILPGYAPTEVIVDVSFDSGFDTGIALIGALCYLVIVLIITTGLFWRGSAPRRRFIAVISGN